MTWTLPQIDLPRSQPQPIDADKLNATLKRALRKLGIECSIERTMIGPTTVQWELLAEGETRMRDFTRLGRREDLAYYLAAESVRIQSPIPGRKVIGIEVPLSPAQRRVVSLREVVEHCGPPLRAGIGVEATGEALTLAIDTLPHLLVAGASGGGKSSLLHSMIASLVLTCTPEDLGLVLIDPKMVEMTRWTGLPHLYAPPVIDTAQAVDALWWLVDEVVARYAVLQEHGFSDLSEYNEAMPDEKLPRVICVVDELADLMMRSRDRVESAVVRLGQLGRACGVHLVLATQSPHANVVTGLIKANMVGRIALNVVSGVHSRVSIDQSGAEKLLGRGDGLLQNGTSVNLTRFQSCYTPPELIREIVDAWVTAKEPEGEGAQVHRRKRKPRPVAA